MPERTLCIVNPASAGGRALVAWSRLQPQFPAHSTTIRFSSAPNHAFQLARDLAHHHDLLIAAGGDGTAREVASGLLASQAPAQFAVLPIGTGNDFAHAIGIPSPAAALSAIRHGHERRLDVIRIETNTPSPDAPHHALVYAAVGAAGEVLRRTTPTVKRWFGRTGAYSIGFLRAWWQLHSLPLSLDHDHGQLQGRFLLVAAGNCECAGGGAMRLSPGANPADGILQLTAAGHLNRPQLLRYFLYLVKGTHPGKPGITSLPITRLAIDSPSPLDVQADGDHAGFTPARFNILPAALRTLTPSKIPN